MAQSLALGNKLNMPRNHPSLGNAQSKDSDSNINHKLQTLDTVSKDLMNLNKPAKKKNPRPKRSRRNKKMNTNEISESLQLMSVQGPSQGLLGPVLSSLYTNQQLGSVAPRQNLGSGPHPYTMGGANPPAPTMTILTRCRFHQNMIETLEKRSQKHPLAEFMCKLCLYYCDTEAVVDKHISDKRHKEALQEHISTCTINLMPEPVPAQLEFLSLLVESRARQNGMTYEDRTQRQEIASHINSAVERNLTGCYARLYGSSLNCLGTKTSDVNIDFVVPNDQSPSKLLLALKDLIAADSRFENVECDLNADLPGIHFKDKTSKLICMVCLNNKNAYEISRLLAHYESIDNRVKTLASVFRGWASICSLDQVALGCWPPYAFDLLLVYYLQQTEIPVLPVLHELVDNPDPNNPEHYLDPADLANKWKTRNKMSTGELWLNLFKFYARDFTISERVVCIRQLAPLKRSVKKWPGRKMAIEDPFTPKRNVSRSIVNIITFDYILFCFRCTYRYFANLQTKSGPIFGCIQMPCSDPALDDVLNASNNNLDVDRILKSDPLYSTNPLQDKCKNYEYLIILPKYAAMMFERFNTQNLFYDFNKKVFTKHKVLPVVCCICQQEGHVKDSCKAEKLPPLQPLPPMTPGFLNHISRLCDETFDNLLPSKEETKQRENIVLAIQEYLLTFNTKAQLELFGSSCNGFGLHKSDLDICLTFKDNPNGEVCNLANIFDELVAKLRKNEKLGNVIAITTAKVPIVKFLHIESKLEGDISVYNTLAQRNTKMLRVYSEIDPRVKIVGFMFKRFAKLCDICDASRGSLSSYAYTLMVIYFLQRCDPPLVPVLQQLCKPNQPAKQVIVEGCNTYFFDSVDKLAQVWPGYKKNNTSVGELWLQLLLFYTEKFDFKIDVIAIRQLETLHRFEKLWNSKSIAIEDPFDLSHNLGAGLSRKMHLFIVNALRRGRTLFGTPIELKPGCSLQAYFFDTTRLVDGTPPRDRCCKLCNKIGHVVKDCPRKIQEFKGQYDEIIKAEKEIYYRRRGVVNRGSYENGGRGMHRPQRGGLPKDGLSSGERQLKAFLASGPQRAYSKEMRGSHVTQYEQMRVAMGYGSTGSPVQHHANVSCAPNWRGPVEQHQAQRSYSDYSNDQEALYLRTNYRPFRAEQERSHGNAYNREEAQTLRSSPPRRSYESQRHQFMSSGGRTYEHPDGEYGSPNQNSGRYK